MRKDLEKKAMELLSEPFSAPYGFGYALAEDLNSLGPEDREEYLVLVLESFGLVKSKDALSRPEATLDKATFDRLFDPLMADIEALCHAVFLARPKTAVFARMILHLVQKKETLPEHGLILSTVTSVGLLPYAPEIPKPESCTPEELEKLLNEHRKEMAKIMRVAREGGNLWELSDTVLQILPKNRRARTALLSFFLDRFARNVSVPGIAMISIEKEGGGGNGGDVGDDDDRDPLPTDPDKKKLN